MCLSMFVTSSNLSDWPGHVLRAFGIAFILFRKICVFSIRSTNLLLFRILLYISTIRQVRIKLYIQAELVCNSNYNYYINYFPDIFIVNNMALFTVEF